MPRRGTTRSLVLLWRSSNVAEIPRQKVDKKSNGFCAETPAGRLLGSSKSRTRSFFAPLFYYYISIAPDAAADGARKTWPTGRGAGGERLCTIPAPSGQAVSVSRCLKRRPGRQLFRRVRQRGRFVCVRARCFRESAWRMRAGRPGRNSFLVAARGPTRGRRRGTKRPCKQRDPSFVREIGAQFPCLPVLLGH